MSFPFHNFEASQAGRPQSVDQGDPASINDQTEYNSFGRSAISSPVERRSSVPGSLYSPFPPTPGAVQWPEDAYQAPNNMNDSHGRYVMSSPTVESMSNGAYNTLIHHHGAPVQWQSIDHTGILHTTLPTTTMSLITSGITQIIEPATVVPYPSALASQIPITSPASTASEVGPVTSPFTTSQAFSLPSPSITGQDYIALADDDVKSIRSALHRSSPNRNLAHDFRSNGVRKKNARQDIPEGRSLKNIDYLIRKATDAGREDDAREMKQQKRLLRNRQAALDSRNRKRELMSTLEQEKKTWQPRLDELTEQMQQLTSDNEQLQRENHDLQMQVQKLTQERQSQLEHHNRETMLLRADIDRLKSMHTKSEHSGFCVETYPAFSQGFDSLSINDCWDFGANTDPYPDSDTSLSAMSDHPIKKGSNHTRLPSLNEKMALTENQSDIIEPVTSG